MYIKIRSLFFLIGWIAFISNAWAWNDERTHRDLSRIAAQKSVLNISNGDYLKNLGYTKGDEETFTLGGVSKKVWKWIEDGGEEEDAGNIFTAYYYHHFHNPLRPWPQAGLTTIYPGINGESSLLWAQDDTQDTTPPNPWRWQKVRDYYYLALTSQTDTPRQENFANTFKGLGHIIHLIQDAAQPAHVRDDPHPLDDWGIVPQFENWAKSSENQSAVSSFMSNPGFPSVPLNISVSGYTPITQFWDINKYDGTNPNEAVSNAIGISEYTNANFFSEDTIFTEPYPAWSSVVEYDETIDATTGEERTYLRKTGDGEIIQHLATGRWFYKYLPTEYKRLGLKLDDNVYNDYASLLLPRAVGYSAGLINYFFRGTLEISAPDSYLYSIIDGSETPYIDTYGNWHQQFTSIKAKIRNTTPNEEIQNGIIQAVARYKKRIDYQPDLSTDPPTAASREPEFSYSVSAPITITSLSSTVPEEFTFDFSNSPIPAGITDLYLHVIFNGTLGNEIDTAIAVGMKDINEPMHISVWNATDRFYLDGVLRTAEEIRIDPLLLSRVDHNGDGISDEFIDPYDLTTNLAFTTTTDIPAVYNVIYAPMPPGRYGRVIILTDAPSFYMHIHRESTDPVDSLDTYFLFSGVINQETDGIFDNTQVYTFRGIIQHEWSAFARYYPDYTGISTAPWPVPTITDPYPATTINP